VTCTLSVVELLFEKSRELMIDLNATDNMNLTSFHWACQEGHTEVAQLFLEKADEFKLDLNVADYELEWTPFHFACHEGRRSIVDMILEKSEDVKIFINLYDKLARTGKDFLIKRLSKEIDSVILRHF
jgi:ankyrin repeat protein